MSYQIDQKKYLNRLSSALKYNEAGKITQSVGLLYEAHLPGASVGSYCTIHPTSLERGYEAEVIGFRDKRVLLMPYEDIPGLNNDSLVELHERNSKIVVSEGLLGRVIDPLGNPIDDLGPIAHKGREPLEQDLYSRSMQPMKRDLISKPVGTGIRAIDGLLTCGKGQRMGVMAGSGVGKSVLLGMIAQNTSADVNVIALIGERGREVREFIERDLGAEGLKRSVVIVATSDVSPLLRMRGAYLSLSVAEYFRDRKKDVMLLMDSVTRFCMAQREIGLAMGEPPATKGYTPSVFSTLPKILERAGPAQGAGSITGMFTVLVEGDDLDDPIADSARSVLDGHIVLSRRLAERAHFPAIDILQSTSRVMPAVVTPQNLKSAMKVKEWIATYREAEDLINIGAYVPGSNPEIDKAVSMHSRINKFLKQDIRDASSLTEAQGLIEQIVAMGQADNAQ